MGVQLSRYLPSESGKRGAFANFYLCTSINSNVFFFTKSSHNNMANADIKATWLKLVTPFTRIKLKVP